jgi:cytoskeletal protein CcmA (bactofilin family)
MLFGKNVHADQPVNSKDKHLAPTKLMERSPLTAKPTSASNQANGNVLIVGDGIRLKGEITACDRLVVEGHVEVSLNETRAVEIKPKGRFIGSCEVEEAEISGVYEGDLTVRGRLTVYASGQVEGQICYGEIELERGGRISGNLGVRGSALSGGAKTAGAVQSTKAV